MTCKVITLRPALTDHAYFGLPLSGPSWLQLRILLLPIMGEPPEAQELLLFQGLTGRPSAPAEPVREFAGIIWPPGRQKPFSGCLGGLSCHVRRPSWSSCAGRARSHSGASIDERSSSEQLQFHLR